MDGREKIPVEHELQSERKGAVMDKKLIASMLIGEFVTLAFMMAFFTTRKDVLVTWLPMRTVISCLAYDFLEWRFG